MQTIIEMINMLNLVISGGYFKASYTRYLCYNINNYKSSQKRQSKRKSAKKKKNQAENKINIYDALDGIKAIKS